MILLSFIKALHSLKMKIPFKSDDEGQRSLHDSNMENAIIDTRPMHCAHSDAASHIESATRSSLGEDRDILHRLLTRM